ncbi:hypothetical protein AHF37_06115 [Paragonimus kellicotti]|nr:hypothetical protein AHF37_06115 [Paragonimus kellicotti]
MHAPRNFKYSHSTLLRLLPLVSCLQVEFVDFVSS